MLGHNFLGHGLRVEGVLIKGPAGEIPVGVYDLVEALCPENMRLAEVQPGQPTGRAIIFEGTFGRGKWRARHWLRKVGWEVVGSGKRAEVAIVLNGNLNFDRYAINMLLRFLLAEALARSGGLALHGAAVSTSDGVAVFLAHSGGGKTTLVRTFAANSSLGDDLTLLVREGDGFFVYPAPVSGREGTPIQGSAGPLWRLCELHKGPSTRVDRMSKKEQVEAILKHTIVFTADKHVRQAILDTALALVERVGVVRLEQALDEPPWTALKNA